MLLNLGDTQAVVSTAKAIPERSEAYSQSVKMAMESNCDAKLNVGLSNNGERFGEQDWPPLTATSEEADLSDDSDLSDNSDVTSDEDDDGVDSLEVSDKQLEELESKVKAAPFDYDAHCSLVSVYRSCGELEKLRSARHVFRQCLPIKTEECVEWIRDEISVGSSVDDIRTLFEGFLEDMPASFLLWLEYIQWSCGTMTADEVRSLFEKAITAVGLHVTQANLLWSCYREYERCWATAEQNGKAEEHQENLLKIYRRQLSVAAEGLEDVYSEYVALLGGGEVDNATKFVYESSLRELNLLRPFEKALDDSKEDPTTAYSRYIDFELGRKNPARLTCLFERAIADMPFNKQIWLRYLSWLDSSIKTPEVCLRAFQRAARFLPADVEVWQRSLLGCEYNNASWEMLAGMANRAFGVGNLKCTEAVELWLLHIYQYRRKCAGNSAGSEEVCKLFEDGSQWLKQNFGDRYWDMDGWYKKCWARYLASECGRMEEARSLWKDVMKGGNGRLASFWMDYIWFERQFGDHVNVAALFLMASNSVTDFPEVVFNEWLQFLREEGSIEELWSAMHRIEKQQVLMKKKNFKKTKVQESRKRPANARPNIHDEPITSFKHRKEVDTLPAKRDNVAPPSQVDRKVDADGFVIPPLPKAAKLSNSSSNIADSDQHQQRPVTQNAEGAHAEDSTVFVSNLDFSLTKEQLAAAFDDVGEVKEVRMMMLRPNRSKGYAYVEFKNPESVPKALSLDRRLVEGRPMYVSVCRPAAAKQDNEATERPSTFKYFCGLEKNKLFVKNLASFVTEKDLEDLFKPFGELRSVRLVVHKSGQSKGLAYIEYADESSADRALSKTDGTYFHKKRLSVQLSNPPPRQHSNSSEAMKSTPYDRLAVAKEHELLSRTIFFILRFYNDRVEMADESSYVNGYEEELVAPYLYVSELPAKQVRNRLIEAFNFWLQVPDEKVRSICEVVNTLHNASLMIDDIEDDSIFRRGQPVAHKVFGVAATINSANYMYFVALQSCCALGHPDAVKIFTEQMLQLHRGQGMDIFWRDSVTCPTEEKYYDMILKKTGGLFLLSVGLTQLFSSNKTSYDELVRKFAIYFQIRDDYANLTSKEYADLKTFAEDLTEGKFSYPIIHAVLNGADRDEVLEILRRRVTSIEMKQRCVELLQRSGSLEYTRRRLSLLADEILSTISSFGGNEKLAQMVNSLRDVHSSAALSDAARSSLSSSD
uniref:RRM domain-containing protein n=1 Tax=Trichuris muris TaxID=70415 RepID=A0A5S6QUZ7_TRIMR